MSSSMRCRSGVMDRLLCKMKSLHMQPVHLYRKAQPGLEPLKTHSVSYWESQTIRLPRSGLVQCLLCRARHRRHTWASWHIQGGTPLFALQELGGWETERMVRRYAHLAADHLASYVGNAQIHGTFLTHQPKLPKLLDEKVLEAQ